MNYIVKQKIKHTKYNSCIGTTRNTARNKVKVVLMIVDSLVIIS